GDIQKRSAGLIRAGGILVSIVGPTEARPADGLAVDFVVESDRAQLREIVRRGRGRRLRRNIGHRSCLDGARATFHTTRRRAGGAGGHAGSCVSDTRQLVHAGTSIVSAAVTNAIFAATGKRLRNLPFDTDSLKSSS